MGSLSTSPLSPAVQSLIARNSFVRFFFLPRDFLFRANLSSSARFPLSRHLVIFRAIFTFCAILSYFARSCLLLIFDRAIFTFCAILSYFARSCLLLIFDRAIFFPSFARLSSSARSCLLSHLFLSLLCSAQFLFFSLPSPSSSSGDLLTSPPADPPPSHVVTRPPSLDLSLMFLLLTLPHLLPTMMMIYTGLLPSEKGSSVHSHSLLPSLSLSFLRSADCSLPAVPYSDRVRPDSSLLS